MVEPEGIGIARFCHRGDVKAADAGMLQSLGHGIKAHVVPRFVGKQGFPFAVGTLCRGDFLPVSFAKNSGDSPAPFGWNERFITHKVSIDTFGARGKIAADLDRILVRIAKLMAAWDSAIHKLEGPRGEWVYWATPDSIGSARPSQWPASRGGMGCG